MMIRFYILLIFLGILYSCTSTQKKSTQDELSVFSGIFIVNELYGLPIEKTDLTLKINNDTSKISGLSGCNTYSIGFVQNNTVIRFTKAITTRMLCEEKVMEKERQFLNIFATTKEFSIKEDTLVLYDEEKEVLKATRFIF